MRYRFVKRWIDIVGSLCGLIVLLPVGAVITLVLFFTGGQPFFRQHRPGKNGKIFRLLKFKTMNDRCDACGCLLPDARRLTAVGRLLRKTSLDELPQLVNVLRGEMSLIGPRPLLPEYLHLYTPEQARRHEVRPGITGWAQVNGRNAISWEQKFEYDTWYVDHLSFALDRKILGMTLLKVFRTKEIDAAPDAPMEKFTGTYNPS